MATTPNGGNPHDDDFSVYSSLLADAAILSPGYLPGTSLDGAGDLATISAQALALDGGSANRSASGTPGYDADGSRLPPRAMHGRMLVELRRAQSDLSENAVTKSELAAARILIEGNARKAATDAASAPTLIIKTLQAHVTEQLTTAMAKKVDWAGLKGTLELQIRNVLRSQLSTIMDSVESRVLETMRYHAKEAGVEGEIGGLAPEPSVVNAAIDRVATLGSEFEGIRSRADELESALAGEAEARMMGDRETAESARVGTERAVDELCEELLERRLPKIIQAEIQRALGGEENAFLKRLREDIDGALAAVRRNGAETDKRLRQIVAENADARSSFKNLEIQFAKLSADLEGCGPEAVGELRQELVSLRSKTKLIDDAVKKVTTSSGAGSTEIKAIKAELKTLQRDHTLAEREREKTGNAVDRGHAELTKNLAKAARQFKSGLADARQAARGEVIDAKEKVAGALAEIREQRATMVAGMSPMGAGSASPSPMGRSGGRMSSVVASSMTPATKGATVAAAAAAGKAAAKLQIAALEDRLAVIEKAVRHGPGIHMPPTSLPGSAATPGRPPALLASPPRRDRVATKSPKEVLAEVSSALKAKRLRALDAVKAAAALDESTLDMEALQRMMEQTGVAVRADDLVVLFDHLDADADGVIDAGELVAAIRRVDKVDVPDVAPKARSNAKSSKKELQMVAVLEPRISALEESVASAVAGLEQLQQEPRPARAPVPTPGESADPAATKAAGPALEALREQLVSAIANSTLQTAQAAAARDAALREELAESLRRCTSESAREVSETVGTLKAALKVVAADSAEAVRATAGDSDTSHAALASRLADEQAGRQRDRRQYEEWHLGLSATVRRLSGRCDALDAIRATLAAREGEVSDMGHENEVLLREVRRRQTIARGQQAQVPSQGPVELPPTLTSIGGASWGTGAAPPDGAGAAMRRSSRVARRQRDQKRGSTTQKVEVAIPSPEKPGGRMRGSESLPTL